METTVLLVGVGSDSQLATEIDIVSVMEQIKNLEEDVDSATLPTTLFTHHALRFETVKLNKSTDYLVFSLGDEDHPANQEELDNLREDYINSLMKFRGGYLQVFVTHHLVRMQAVSL